MIRGLGNKELCSKDPDLPGEVEISTHGPTGGGHQHVFFACPSCGSAVDLGVLYCGEAKALAICCYSGKCEPRPFARIKVGD